MCYCSPRFFGCAARPQTEAATPEGPEMESWLLDVKRVRIPRPKFASARHGGGGYPTEPPKDYSVGSMDDSRDDKSKRGDYTSRELTKATEELRRAVQEKL